jgi:hypothetical protein
MLMTLMMWAMTQQTQALAYIPTPVPFDFAALPVAGTTDVPLNAEILVPVPISQTFSQDAPSADEYRVSLLSDNDVEVGASQEIQVVTHTCFDMEVVRIKPSLPLTRQTRYRVVIDPVAEGFDSYEATSFLTGDRNDEEAPAAPVVTSPEIRATCGTTVVVEHEPQTVVTAMGLTWNGLTTSNQLTVDGSDGAASLVLVAIDMAGNISLPRVVDVEFPASPSGNQGCGCNHNPRSPPWGFIALLSAWLLLRRRS